MIRFNMIQRENIFGDEFLNFQNNNCLNFDSKKIIVIYGPNGTGKTSLAKILGSDEGCEFNLVYNDLSISNQDNELFHIINDQNGRNLIVGETKDFLLGEDIRREYELKDNLEKEFKVLFESTLVNALKNEFSIKKKKSGLISRITDENLRLYVSDIANRKSKGSEIIREQYTEYISSMNIETIDEYNNDKFSFLVNDLSKKKSIISNILEITNETLIRNNDVIKVEQNSEAIKILKKFPDVTDCVVCDGNICVEEKLNNKIESKNQIYEIMEPQTKEILEKLLIMADNNDPFEIKQIILKAITDGNFQIIEELKTELCNFISIFNQELKKIFKSSLDETDIVENLDEYNCLIHERPELSDEDVIFIEHIVNENIEKSIELVRDENRTLRLVLDGSEFLNKDRQELKLSNGEQNFISLAFELLKAKNTNREIIVLDDPISSFDSIFKNKIAFSIIKFLSSKKQIVLTHNLELIKLLEHQYRDCFKLYLFNNTVNEDNGFFELSNEEIGHLIYIHKLVDFFRNNVIDEINNERLFLMSMVPFLRGYSQIVFKQNEKNQLTELMHGYNDITHNVSDIYNELFGNVISFTEEHSFSANDIINENIENFSIFKQESNYKLLEKTLKHTLTYLYLRLKVENKLIDKFNINPNTYDMLSSIIFRAFRGNEKEVIKKRVFLASKKTLLNEFNHFEGNMNIFQPAIDITDSALNRERISIESFLDEL